MPRRPQWIKDLPEITQLTEGLPIALIARETFERLFNLQRTAAAYWLRRFGAETYGTTLLIEKRRLLLELYRLAESREYQLEDRRRARLSDRLEDARRDLIARRVRVPIQGEPPRSLARLPANIALTPGHLEVSFHGTEDLLRALHEISTAAAADWVEFQRACGD